MYGNSIHDRLRAAGYEALPPFFILDEHEHVRDDGKGVERFDRQRLERIANGLNSRMAPPAVSVGHTHRVPGAPQPPVAGVTTDHHVVFFKKDPATGKDLYGIRCTPWSMPGCKEQFRKNPRRSIELWVGPNGDDIDPIAILGSTTPRRDLDLHVFARQADPTRYHFSREVDDMPNDPNDTSTNGNGNGSKRIGDMTLDELAAGLLKTAPFAQMQSITQEMSDLLSQEDPSQQAGNPPGAPPGAAPPGAAPPGMDVPPPGPGPEDRPEQYRMNPIYRHPVTVEPPTLDHNGVPLYFSQQPQPYYYGGQPPVSPGIYQAQFQQAIVAATAPLQQKIDQQNELIVKMQKRDEEKDIDAELTRLADVDKVVFDRAGEKAELLKMSPEARTLHFKRMRDNYKREGPGTTLPNNGDFPFPIQMTRLPLLTATPAEIPGTEGMTATDLAFAASRTGARTVTDYLNKQQTNGQAGVVKTR